VLFFGLLKYWILSLHAERRRLNQGFQIFLAKFDMPKREKYTKMTTKFTNIFHCKTLKIYPNWYFCLEIYHLATLVLFGSTFFAEGFSLSGVRVRVQVQLCAHRPPEASSPSGAA
jgi:fatty acid desaturase